MTVIPFRSKTLEPCPAFCQEPAGHPFLQDDVQDLAPYRKHTATFGGAQAVRWEYRDRDEDGLEVSAWDGQPDLPDIYHEAMRHNPWQLGDAQQIVKDLTALTGHIDKHIGFQPGPASNERGGL